MNLVSKLVITFSIIFLFSCTRNRDPFYGNSHFVNIDFIFNDSIIDFYENADLVIFNYSTNEKYVVPKFKNYLYIPQELGDDTLKLYLTYYGIKEYTVYFDKLVLGNYRRNWRFEIDETPQNNNRSLNKSLIGTGYYLEVGKKNEPRIIMYSKIVKE